MCMNTDVLDKSKFKKQGVHVLAFGWQLPSLKLRMETVLHSIIINVEILNQVRTSHAPGFLELFLCERLYVCVSSPEAINN